jgi:FKBP-type peptidyl-prolyl cis-trans isomerase
MSFGISAATWAMVAAATTVAGVYVQNESARKSNNLQQEAMQNAKQAALKQEAASDQAFNKANAKTPDVASIMSGASQSARSGGGGTMLTGPQGIDMAALNLGKSTLLGM